MKALEQPLAEQLVRLARLETPPLEEIRYATKYNFTGTRLYPFPIAFLQKDAAACLEKNPRIPGCQTAGTQNLGWVSPLIGAAKNVEPDKG
jgi:D-alanyl-D-alanine dipeptidase